MTTSADTPPQRLRLGVIYNSRSGQHKKAWARQPLPAGIPVFATQTPDQIRAALAQMAALGIQVLAVAGGDGTVMACLGELLLGSAFGQPPIVAIIPTGSTNMTGNDAGLVQVRKQGWQPLLDYVEQPRALAQHCTERPVLRIQHGPHEPVCGMFFGAGALHHAVGHTQGKYHQLGLRGEVGPGLAFLRFAKAVASNNLQQLSPVHARIRTDHGVELEQGNVLLLATTLERLVLNFRPYWGEEQGPIHWTAVADDAKGFLRRILAVTQGNARRLPNKHGYYSHNSTRVQLWFDGGYIVDGEFFEARQAAGPVTLEIAGHIRFLHL